MISFSIVFFHPLNFLSLRSMSTVSNSFYLSFFHSSPSLSRSLIMQSPSQFRSSFHSTFWASALFASFSSPIYFHMTNPCTAHQLLLRTFLHSHFHSHFIKFLLSALLTPTIILSGCFSQTWTFSCCFSVSAIVCNAFKYAGITHELSTFPFRLRFASISYHTIVLSPSVCPGCNPHCNQSS